MCHLFFKIVRLGYYGAQPQTGVPGGVPQAGYSFPGYGYGAPTTNAAPSSNTQEN